MLYTEYKGFFSILPNGTLTLFSSSEDGSWQFGVWTGCLGRHHNVRSIPGSLECNGLTNASAGPCDEEGAAGELPVQGGKHEYSAAVKTGEAVRWESH